LGALNFFTLSSASAAKPVADLSSNHNVNLAGL
jgi:hypothetical protein